MMRDYRFLGLVAGSAFLIAAALVACSSDDEETSPGGTGGTGAAGGTAGTGGSAGASGEAGTGGTAGTAGAGGTAGTAGTAGTGGGTAGSAGTAGTGGSAGSGGGGVAGDHVLISEIGILASDAEFIEIWNPTDAAVDLSNYYLSDNSVYYTITSGAWNPSQTPGTDFVAQFPSGTTLGPDEVIVVGGNPNGFEAAFASCPDFFLEPNGDSVSCGGGDVPAMLVPANGSVGDQAGALLSNEREMVILFQWDGSSATVQDVDYVTWGTEFSDPTRVDKSNESDYDDDTPRGSQTAADATFEIEGGVPEGGASAARSIERCDAEEPSEVLSGGNGITGHDETSENLASSFSKQEVPTPGQKNACL